MRVGYRPAMGDEQWFPSEDINIPEELKLYHVRVIHLANNQSRKTANYKGMWLYRAQICLAISGVLLGLGVIPIPPFFHIIGHHHVPVAKFYFLGAEGAIHRLIRDHTTKYYFLSAERTVLFFR
jgi:hypothetical protein